MKNLLRIASAALLPLGPCAYPSGFHIPEISIAGLGAANAVVANPDMLGAIPYNPSLAAFHEGTALSGGFMLVHPIMEVTTAPPNAPVTAHFQGKDQVFIPMVSLTHRLSQRMALAFAASVPFGLSTDYPPGTFSVLGDNAPTKSKLDVIQLSPSLAFAFSPHTSLAFGLDDYRIREVVFDTVTLLNRGDGEGIGWHLSASHTFGPWSFGMGFYSHVAAKISGTTTVAGLGAFEGTHTTLDMPWRAQIGLRYQATPRWAVEADISRTGWSSFDKLVLETASPAGTIINENRWQDSNAYRLSVVHRLNAHTELRFGYAFDEKAVPDSHFTARIADADRHLFSLGIERQLGGGWTLEAGYMLAKLKDRAFRGTRASTTDPNGTPAYNGDYRTLIHLVGIGISKRLP